MSTKQTPTEPISLEEQYGEASSAEIISAIGLSTSKKDKVKLMVLLRCAVRREEDALKAELKEENESSKEEKRLMKATQVDLFDSRAKYLVAYRDMNKIMAGMSMLKNLELFEAKVAAYVNAQAIFNKNLGCHVDNLRKIKADG